MIITQHRELANAIAGKSILHCNSLGKDALLTLEWLNNYAHCARIVSVFSKLDAGYPSDDSYWKYLKSRYPKTQFVTAPGISELNEKLSAVYQSPLAINYVVNKSEYEEFSFRKIVEELRVKHACDYIASGMSCYEGMGRAIYLRRTGLLDEKRKTIYPIGLMKYAQVVALLKKMPTKINPSYKFCSESHDSPTYFKMRSAFIVRPKFKENVYRHFPMLRLDAYRFEVLFGKKARA